MTTGPTIIVEPREADAGFDAAYEEVRASDAIQFEPLTLPQPDPPGWLEPFYRWLGEVLEPVGAAVVAMWPVLKYLLPALLIALVVWFLVRALAPLFDGNPRSASDSADDWRPAKQEALALLEEADRLAGEGRYDEATHLLLLRSVGQIAAARPELVEPSSTARELAGERRLPDDARRAFGRIAEPVERSLFALRALGQADWQQARAAYADFALSHDGSHDGVPAGSLAGTLAGAQG